MRKLNNSNSNKIVFLLCCVLCLSIFQLNKAIAQQEYSINLKSDVQSSKFNTYSIRFIPIDSIADENGNILTQITNELNHLQLNKLQGVYFLFKVGYYQADTTLASRNGKAFENIKEDLKSTKSKKVLLIDINCQDVLALNAQVREYEKTTGRALLSSIYISVYKSKNRITSMKQKAKCYLE